MLIPVNNHNFNYYVYHIDDKYYQLTKTYSINKEIQ